MLRNILGPSVSWVNVSFSRRRRDHPHLGDHIGHVDLARGKVFGRGDVGDVGHGRRHHVILQRVGHSHGGFPFPWARACGLEPRKDATAWHGQSDPVEQIL